MKRARYSTDEERRAARTAMTLKHQAICRAANVCINGPKPDSPRPPHGPVVRGGKCQDCIDVHKLGDTTEARLDRHYRAELGMSLPEVQVAGGLWAVRRQIARKLDMSPGRSGHEVIRLAGGIRAVRKALKRDRDD